MLTMNYFPKMKVSKPVDFSNPSWAAARNNSVFFCLVIFHICPE